MSIQKVALHVLQYLIFLCVTLPPIIGWNMGAGRVVYAQDIRVPARPVPPPTTVRPVQPRTNVRPVPPPVAATDSRTSRPVPPKLRGVEAHIKRQRIDISPEVLKEFRAIPQVTSPPRVKGEFFVIDLFKQKNLPSKIQYPDSQTRGRTALVVADTLELDKGTSAFKENGIENLLIVADTVRVKDKVTLDLRSPDKQKAGNLTIIARNYVTEENGLITVLNHGLNKNASPGQLFLVVDKPRLRSKVGKQGTGTLYPPYAIEIQDFFHVENGRKTSAAHVFPLWKGEGINPEVTDGNFIIGYWAAHFLSVIGREVTNIIPLNEGATAEFSPAAQEDLIGWVKKGQAIIPLTNQLSPNEYDEFKVRDSKKLVDTASALLTLWTEEIHLPSNQTVEAVYDGKAKRVFLAPTDALMRVVKHDGRSWLGYLDRDPQDPTQALLSFEIRFSVSPDIEKEVKEMLRGGPNGLEYGGLFVDYDATPNDFTMDLPQVKSQTITVSGGSSLSVTLRVAHEAALMPLTSLASPTGVNLRMAWTARSNQKIKGDWTIPISLARRDSSDGLKLSGQGIQNDERQKVTIEYIELPGPKFFPLEPPVRLESGEKSLPLSFPPDTDVSKGRIPPDAVIYDMDKDPLSAFFSRDAAIYDTVEVTNLLGSHPQLGPLQYVEITLTYSYDPSEGLAPAVKGPFRLSGKGTLGSQYKETFRRRQKGDRDVKVDGVAVYESGSQQKLQARTFRSLAAAIEQDMLAMQ